MSLESEIKYHLSVMDRRLDAFYKQRSKEAKAHFESESQYEDEEELDTDIDEGSQAQYGYGQYGTLDEDEKIVQAELLEYYREHLGPLLAKAARTSPEMIDKIGNKKANSRAIGFITKTQVFHRPIFELAKHLAASEARRGGKSLDQLSQRKQNSLVRKWRGALTKHFYELYDAAPDGSKPTPQAFVETLQPQVGQIVTSYLKTAWLKRSALGSIRSAYQAIQLEFDDTPPPYESTNLRTEDMTGYEANVNQIDEAAFLKKLAMDISGMGQEHDPKIASLVTAISTALLPFGNMKTPMSMQECLQHIQPIYEDFVSQVTQNLQQNGGKYSDAVSDTFFNMCYVGYVAAKGTQKDSTEYEETGEDKKASRVHLSQLHTSDLERTNTTLARALVKEFKELVGYQENASREEKDTSYSGPPPYYSSFVEDKTSSQIRA